MKYLSTNMTWGRQFLCHPTIFHELKLIIALYFIHTVWWKRYASQGSGSVANSRGGHRSQRLSSYQIKWVTQQLKLIFFVNLRKLISLFSPIIPSPNIFHFHTNYKSVMIQILLCYTTF